MTVLEYGNDIVVIDCGLSFPDDDMPGIDIVIPDMSYLRENRAKLKGFFITHGHEDHIGALPHALKEFDVPVYGTAFTIALIEHKLEEARVSSKKLNVVKPGDTVRTRLFQGGVHQNRAHSIAGAVALAVNTPYRHGDSHRRFQGGLYAHRRRTHRHYSLCALWGARCARAFERQHEHRKSRPHAERKRDRQDL